MRRSIVQERMLESVITASGAKRVHLGLDETFGLGHGKYRSSRCKRVTPHECEHPPQASTIFQTHVRRMLVRPALLYRLGGGIPILRG